MYRQCTTEKSSIQQRKLEQCMLEAMLKKDSYDEISISELCRDAGLSRKTFYRLFDSKSDVILAMVDQTFLDSQRYVPGPEIKPGGLHHFFAFWKEQKRLLNALNRHNCTALLMERAGVFILREDNDLAHVLGADLENGREILRFNLSAIFSLVISWYESGYAKSVDEMAALLMDLMTTPMVRAPRAVDPYRE